MLEISNAGRRIRGEWIWNDLNLHLRPGDRLGLEGPTGSGKTLFLRCLAGLDDLDRGSIRFCSKALSEWDLRQYRAAVALIAQVPSLFPGSVEQNLRSPWALAVHRTRDFDRERVVSWLGRFGRDESFLEAHSEDLSGGERQIVAFLRAIQLDPRVLLLDEPASSLDPEQARVLETIVEEWKGERPDRAVVWTSHRVDQLERVTDRRLVLGPDQERSGQ
ncbi:MAG: ATP-binding cassette domain-containing protein [Acidobacteria bacterium]|nr:ATP-binding cassette domain-containing protein [Acidobacteriota bacterium]